MAISLDRLLFIDIEASGLHKGSYPIEIGWSDIDLNAGSFLIAPQADWTEADWDPMAESIHGISRSVCEKEGLPAGRAAAVLADLLSGRHPVSDAPSFDGYWLKRLLDAAGSFDPVSFLHINEVLSSVMAVHPVAAGEWSNLEREVSILLPHTHRAADDALRLAGLARAPYDANFVRSRASAGIHPTVYSLASTD